MHQPADVVDRLQPDDEPGRAARTYDSNEALFWGALFPDLDRSGASLQLQIRQAIVTAVEAERLLPGTRMPSSRDLAALLKVSRNTIVIAYEQLVDQGVLLSRERSGFFVSSSALETEAPEAARPRETDQAVGDGVWSTRFAMRPSAFRNIVKPLDWQDYPYAFIYGQFDPGLFPTNDWRESARAALSVPEINNWARDMIDEDDPALVEQLRTQVLPRRGIRVRADEIMMTIGAQQALFLLAQLFAGRTTRVGVEEPGYPDARNIFRLMTDDVVPLRLDGCGVVADEQFHRCNVAYVTVGHQCPTTSVMPLARRKELLAAARARDVVLIEDDYEAELMPEQEELPPLRSLDTDGRVLYVGSLSKALAPGLRLGYVVAPAPVIRELRALRRLMLRHPPLNNQRVAALFVGLGHYRTHLRRTSQVLRERASLLDEILPQHLPDCSFARGPGSTSYWIECPPGCDANWLVGAARAEGVLIEPGDVFFMDQRNRGRFVRLGFSSIPTHRIEAGIKRLGRLVGRRS